jgi:hypothetical protein
MINNADVVARTNDLRKIEDELLALPNVIAVGVGVIANSSSSDGKPLVGIKVYVDKTKISTSSMMTIDVLQSLPHEIVPISPIKVQRANIGGQNSWNDGRATFDYTMRVRPTLLGGHFGRYDPLVGGVQIQPNANWVGALGGLLYDQSSGTPVAITNWHVADNGSANPIGNPIYQPSWSDANFIGTCSRAVLGQTPTGWVDSALVTLDSSRRRFSQQMAEISGLSTIAADSARLEQRVVKSGRTTGVTTAKIDAVAVVVNVNYGPPVNVVTMRNQLMMRAAPELPNPGGQVSDGGDSGSLWLDRVSNRAIGLNFAGEVPGDKDDRAIANPIFAVLTAVSARFEPNSNTIYRWWSPGANDHFYCSDAGGELAPIVGYGYEGAPFAMLPSSDPNGTPFFRWFSPGSGDHFYTADPTGELAPASGYRAEGSIGNIGKLPGPGQVALYRWFHGGVGDHFYTTDPTGELAPAGGYGFEGIAGYVYPGA